MASVPRFSLVFPSLEPRAQHSLLAWDGQGAAAQQGQCLLQTLDEQKFAGWARDSKSTHPRSAVKLCQIALSIRCCDSNRDPTQKVVWLSRRVSWWPDKLFHLLRASMFEGTAPGAYSILIHAYDERLCATPAYGLRDGCEKIGPGPSLPCELSTGPTWHQPRGRHLIISSLLLLLLQSPPVSSFFSPAASASASSSSHHYHHHSDW